MIKGEHLLRFGALLIFAAFILLIFVHVGQVNPGHVARSLSMLLDKHGCIQTWVSSCTFFTDNVRVCYSATLQALTGDPFPGLYNSEIHSIGNSEGLQITYSWGLYSVCGYTYNATWDSRGTCTKSSIGHGFAPFDTITHDVPLQYSNAVVSLISNSGGSTTDIYKFWIFRDIDRSCLLFRPCSDVFHGNARDVRTIPMLPALDNLTSG
ncbi:hypothetical protein M408DRAFT_158367 [Serendipita vermifera MAFF 305830]|uniref:Uncharacterized protein n=1 Tax=Serendipita vermifera MAFF 305830 TaxID=933852 RepID=A0A0C3BQF7_SERVB|nr:hypothetical protein M408DRAFT_158367 [Serendipita vermifera MAFF 305830]